MEHSYGTIPYRNTTGGHEFLLIHMYGRGGGTHWSFPKGRPEVGETPLQTAVRETTEEVGLTPTHVTEEPTFSEVYTFRTAGGVVVEKMVVYYLATVPDEAVTPQETEIKEYAWLTAPTVLETLTYENTKRLFREVCRELNITIDP